jgi:hypothetical protein
MTYRNINNSTSTSTAVNTNNNVQTGDMTNRNINNSTSTATSTNTNNNIQTGDMTNRNINTTTATTTSQSTSTNNNIQTGDMTNRNINNSTSVSTNNNNNVSTSVSTSDQTVKTDNTNVNINRSEITQRVIQPPPTAIAPAMMSAGTDLCVTGVSGAAQTQIIGMSFGTTNRDMNCERLKLSKTLYDMGMKVAAVATMCQDRRVWDAMMAAGTPCPINGLIGEQAREFWAKNPDLVPKLIEVSAR